MEDPVQLREVTEQDLPVFFAQQLDWAANHMAAFTVEDPADWEAFSARWARMGADTTIAMRTVLVGERVAGHILSFVAPWSGRREISYWIGREYWGHGVATRALTAFLGQVPDRPLQARAASDNLASIRVLRKCGFVVVGHERAFANARGAEIDEVILELRAPTD